MVHAAERTSAWRSFCGWKRNALFARRGFQAWSGCWRVWRRHYDSTKARKIFWWATLCEIFWWKSDMGFRRQGSFTAKSRKRRNPYRAHSTSIGSFSGNSQTDRCERGPSCLPRFFYYTGEAVCQGSDQYTGCPFTEGFFLCCSLFFPSDGHFAGHGTVGFTLCITLSFKTDYWARWCSEPFGWRGSGCNGPVRIDGWSPNARQQFQSDGRRFKKAEEWIVKITAGRWTS